MYSLLFTYPQGVEKCTYINDVLNFQHGQLTCTGLHQTPIASEIGNKVVQVHISSNIRIYSTVTAQPKELKHCEVV